MAVLPAAQVALGSAFSSPQLAFTES